MIMYVTLFVMPHMTTDMPRLSYSQSCPFLNNDFIEFITRVKKNNGCHLWDRDCLPLPEQLSSQLCCSIFSCLCSVVSPIVWTLPFFFWQLYYLSFFELRLQSFYSDKMTYVERVQNHSHQWKYHKYPDWNIFKHARAVNLYQCF
jgi:hypothetical protein